MYERRTKFRILSSLVVTELIDDVMVEVLAHTKGDDQLLTSVSRNLKNTI